MITSLQSCEMALISKWMWFLICLILNNTSLRTLGFNVWLRFLLIDDLRGLTRSSRPCFFDDFRCTLSSIDGNWSLSAQLLFLCWCFSLLALRSLLFSLALTSISALGTRLRPFLSSWLLPCLIGQDDSILDAFLPSRETSLLLIKTHFLLRQSLRTPSVNGFYLQTSLCEVELTMQVHNLSFQIGNAWPTLTFQLCPILLPEKLLDKLTQLVDLSLHVFHLTLPSLSITLSFLGLHCYLSKENVLVLKKGFHLLSKGGILWLQLCLRNPSHLRVGVRLLSLGYYSCLFF